MKAQEIHSVSLRTALLALAMFVIILTFWELYWRAEGYYATPNDDKHLWAEQRGKVNTLDDDEIVIIGASRVMFDFQLNEWKQACGKKPIMLAAAGTNPLPVLKDVVENTEFSGTIIMGVTPALYFMPLDRKIRPVDRIMTWLDHYYNRTYADRFNHFLAKNTTQQMFAFLTSSNEIFYNELDLETLINWWLKGTKNSVPPAFPILYRVDGDRNVSMTEWTMEDTSYANMVKSFWMFACNPPPESLPPPEVLDQIGRKDIIALSTELVEKFKARGGKIVFVRPPSSGEFRELERKAFPRDKFWDELISKVNCPAYHFEDYEFMNKYHLPEWSHIATPEAKVFTTDFVNQLKKDGHL